MRPPAIDPTTDFFAGIAAVGYHPLLANATGTLRFDVVDPEGVEHWHVEMEKGTVRVSHRNRRADVVVRIDRELADAVTCGHTNAMAAMLRGELVPDGDLRLVMLFQRLFPGPPRAGSAA